MTKVLGVEADLMSQGIDFFTIESDPAGGQAREQIRATGLLVTEKLCPPGAAEWASFPYVREPSGSAYYGPDGISAFVERIRRLNGGH